MGNEIMMKRRFTLFVIVLLALIGCAETPETVIARVNQHLAAKKYKAAAIELKTLLQQRPNDIQARWLLGNVYLDVEDGASAEKELRTAASLGLAEDSVLPAIARALILQSKYKDVLSIEVPHTVSKETLGQLLAFQSLASFADGDVGNAREYARESVETGIATPYLRIAQARVLAADGKLDEARSVLISATESFPDSGVAWGFLGDLHFFARDFAKAESAYSEAIQRHFTATDERIKRGVARFAQKNFEGAEKDADFLLRNSAGSPRTQYFVGLVRLQQGRLQEAAEALEAAYAKANEHIPTRLLLANVYFQLGQRSRALALAEGVVATAPDFLPGKKLLVSVYLAEKKGREAEELLRPMVNADPRDLATKSALATSLVLQNKLKAATTLLAEMARQNPSEPMAHLRAGAAMIASGEGEAGVAALRQAAKLAPEDDIVSSAVVAGFIEQGVAGEALRTAQELSERQPKDPAAWNLLGTAYLAKGDLDGAEKSFRSALSLASQSVVALRGLAKVSIQRADSQAARRFLNDALKIDDADAISLYDLASLEAQGNPASSSVKGLLERAVDADPAFAEAKVALARHLLSENDANAAWRILTIPGTPSNPEIDFLRAGVLNGIGRYDEAERILTGLLDDAPDSAEIHFALSQIYARQGNLEGLKKSLDRVVKIDPESWAAKLVKIRLLILEGRYEDARSAIGALDLPEDHIGILSARLLLENRQRNYLAALAIAQQLFVRQPNTTNLVALSVAYSHAGRTNDAGAVLAKWVGVHANDLVAAKMLAEFYKERGDDNGAIQALERVVSIEPGDVAALNDLAWFLRERDPVRGYGLAQQAYDLAPSSPLVLDTYAELLARNGRSELALSVIERAISASNGSEAFVLRRAEIFWLIGRRDDAISELRAVRGSGSSEQTQQRVMSLLREWRG